MRSEPIDIVVVLNDLLLLFEGRCADKTTIKNLVELVNDRDKWPEAYRLFNEIREKTLAAEKRRDEFALTQYAFEEICAKTLYNISNSPAPFDADSPFWVLPLAIQLGRQLGISKPSEISTLLDDTYVGRPQVRTP
jgi:hypothetical protein